MRRKYDFLRYLAAIMVFSCIITFPPQPVQAVSTSREIQMGQEGDKEILKNYDVLKDPLLNQWVNDIGNNLWSQTVRKDVPYNIKILDTSDINAFSTLGGYIYINAGTLDFVQSDDELAGVIGHETGHIERRHGVTYPAKAQILDVLMGITSLFSPLTLGLGQFAEAGILAHTSRIQEFQADRYGLLLMSRAGYDPEAMLSFMKHLGVVHDENNDTVDKYLADHPGFSDRIAHLLGYRELDPTKLTKDQLWVQAIHDKEAARYSIAAMKLQHIVRNDPTNAEALLNLGEMQVALGLPNKGEQTLTEANEKGLPALRAEAREKIEQLHAQWFYRSSSSDLLSLRSRLNVMSDRQMQMAKEIVTRRKAAKDQIASIEASINAMTSEDIVLPDGRKNSRLSTIEESIVKMSRLVNTTGEKIKNVVAGIGSLEKGSNSGLLKENINILEALGAPLKLDPVPPQSQANIPNYPTMLSDIDLATDDMLHALDANFSALTFLDTGLKDLNDLFQGLRPLQNEIYTSNDISQKDFSTLFSTILEARITLEKAAACGTQAWQLYNLARSRQIQTRVTMLGLAFPKERYTTLQYALQQRVKNSGLDYETMIHENLTPGEVAAAAVIAADTNTTPTRVVQEARATNRHIIDVASVHSMSAYSLEIFLDLLYLDYTDDPNEGAQQNISVDTKSHLSNTFELPQ
jgi:predicted Zn-dependent protease